MNATRSYVGGCEACDETLHSGDVGAIVYTDLGYGTVCEACARVPANFSFLTTDVGPIVANVGSRWQPWTVVSAPDSPTARLRSRIAAGNLGRYADDSALVDAARRYVSEVR